MSAAVTTSFFIILGVASITSTLSWGPLLHRRPKGTGPATVAVVLWLSPTLLALAIGASLLHREHDQAHGL